MKLLRRPFVSALLGILLLLPFSGPSALAAPHEAWVDYYGGDFGRDAALDMALDAAGNVIVTGLAAVDGNGDDFATVKCDPDGNVLWTALHDGSGNDDDVARAVAVDHVGNAYVTGESTGAGTTGRDYLTIKYDPDGNELWASRYSGQDDPSQDFASDVAVDGSGCVYVTGRSEEDSPQNGTDITTVKYGPDGQELWVAHYNGPGSDDDAGHELAIDAAGNVYVAGTSHGGGTYRDFVLIKYGPDGSQLWVRRYDGPNSGTDVPNALALDPWGNILLTGMSYGVGTYNDYATLKYDSAGTLLWIRRFDSPASRGDHAEALAVDSAGNVIVTGTGHKKVGFSTVAAFVTIKYDPDGNPLWEAWYEGPSQDDDEPVAVDVDEAGNVFVFGKTEEGAYGYYAAVKYDDEGHELWEARYESGYTWPSAMAVDSSGAVIVTGTSYDDFVTLKYNADGEEVWLAWYDGPGKNTQSDEEAEAVVADEAGNCFVTGSGGDGRDFVTVKYDTVGGRVWTARYDGPRHLFDEARSLALDGSGNVYVTGSSEGPESIPDYATVKYDPNGNELWAARYDGPDSLSDQASALAVDVAGHACVTGSSQGAGTGLDYLTVKYDTNGVELWTARYDGPGTDNDEASAVAVDPSGNVYVTGGSGGESASLDYATLKYDPNGGLLWAARYDGPAAGEDVAVALALDAAGNVYVTGRSEGVATSFDYATLKYDADGSLLWAARCNGPVDRGDEAAALVVDPGGNVYVTGKSMGDPTNLDYMTVKYRPDGSEHWRKSYNYFATSWDEARAIALDASFNVYVTGETFTDATGKQSATLRYNPEGNRIWLARSDGSSESVQDPSSIAVDSAGNVYVTGRSRSGYGYDFATVKYAQMEPTDWTVAATVMGPQCGASSQDGSTVLNYAFLLGLPILMAGAGITFSLLRRRRSATPYI